MRSLTIRALMLLWAVAPWAAHAEPKPNILVIFTDDHGYADLGAQGVDRDIRTPNLDTLAREGVRFTNGYVSAPQCVPSRAGLLTGRYQQRFGLEDNRQGALPLSEQTIAERLRAAGYVTGQVGKWHLDLPKAVGEDGERDRTPQLAAMPHAHGFDEYWRGEMGQYVVSHALDGHRFADAPHRLTDDRFRVVVQTEAALSFLDRRRAKPEQPWFLYLAWFAPHTPLASPEPWFSRTPAGLPLQRRQALAMIAAMDEGVGRIREKLRALGTERRTLIFFIGDNGAPLRPNAWNGSLNRPLVGEKGMLTDGGTRIPFVAAWPGTLPAGKIYERPVSSLDVAATAVALAGLPHDPVLDGVDLVPFMTGRNTGNPHEALFWRWRSQGAVRAGRWKFVMVGPDRRLLFDLDSAEGENRDRLAEFPAVADDLQKKLIAWDRSLPAPHLPRGANRQDRLFFDPLAKPADTGARPAAPAK